MGTIRRNRKGSAQEEPDPTVDEGSEALQSLRRHKVGQMSAWVDHRSFQFWIIREDFCMEWSTFAGEVDGQVYVCQSVPLPNFRRYLAALYAIRAWQLFGATTYCQAVEETMKVVLQQDEREFAVFLHAHFSEYKLFLFERGELTAEIERELDEVIKYLNEMLRGEG